MQQRYYDPAIGRFLSVDPVTADGDTGANFNRYAYVRNNPLNLTDPSGLAGCNDAVDQGLSGQCLDASNFKPEKDGGQTVISEPAVDQSARENMSSLETKQAPERFAQFTKDEDGWSCA